MEFAEKRREAEKKKTPADIHQGRREKREEQVKRNNFADWKTMRAWQREESKHQQRA